MKSVLNTKVFVEISFHSFLVVPSQLCNMLEHYLCCVVCCKNLCFPAEHRLELQIKSDGFCNTTFYYNNYNIVHNSFIFSQIKYSFKIKSCKICDHLSCSTKFLKQNQELSGRENVKKEKDSIIVQLRWNKTHNFLKAECQKLSSSGSRIGNDVDTQTSSGLKLIYLS